MGDFEGFRWKLMKIALIVALCSFVLVIMIILGLTKYGLLIAAGIIILYLIFRKKNMRHFSRHHHHRHYRHRRFKRR